MLDTDVRAPEATALSAAPGGLAPTKAPNSAAPRLVPDGTVALSNNEMPDPPPQSVLAAIRAAIENPHRYPDSGCTDVTNAIADRLGVRTDQVLVTAGSGELLLEAWHLAARSPSGRAGAAFAVPGFPLYDLACARTGMRPVHTPLRADGGQDIDAMIEAGTDAGTGMIVVCNPHNPTGTYVTAADLSRLVGSVDPDVLIVIDEAYREFADAPDFPDPLPLIADHPNVLVARTFSKAYGLAGLRIGYAVAAPANVAALKRFQVPFTVSVPAQAAALAWMRCPDEVTPRIAQVQAQREHLAAGLTERGFRVRPGQGNFVYAEGTGEAADRPWEQLLAAQGIAVRSAGAGIRVTVGRLSDHDLLFAAIDRLTAC
jgi:histidinol-phosphate aminotransferase